MTVDLRAPRIHRRSKLAIKRLNSKTFKRENTCFKFERELAERQGFRYDVILFFLSKVTSMFEKLSVRNIPSQIFAALEFLAIAHDRSTEAEARHAIRAWVEPSLVKHERNARRTEVAERLGRMLEQVNNQRYTNKLRPSHIAMAIGESKSEEVEDWFLGLQEPTFKQLAAIAHHLGVQPKWLQHGDGCMFYVASERLPSNPFEAVEWLLSWEIKDGEQEATVSNIYFVRELSEVGGLVVIKKSSLGHYRIFTTPYHVSEHIGAGGEASLTHLFVMWEALYKRFTKNSASFHVSSYLAKPEDFRLLYEGNTIPDKVLSDSNKSMWWEDIWDEKMQTKHEYWPGWHSLFRRIAYCIEHSPGMVRVREEIRAGTPA